MQKDCSVEELGTWADLLAKWKDVTIRPRQLPGLVRKASKLFCVKFNLWEIKMISQALGQSSTVGMGTPCMI